MKATLTFSLPEDADEHRGALEGISFRWAIEDFDNWLREQHKYHDEEWAERVRTRLRETLSERGLDLDH